MFFRVQVLEVAFYLLTFFVNKITVIDKVVCLLTSITEEASRGVL